MGMRVVPSYVINTMGAFEAKFGYTYHKQPLVYIRYTDDIFIIWQHRMESQLCFIEHLTLCSEHLTFTHEVSRKKVGFLDTWPNGSK